MWDRLNRAMHNMTLRQKLFFSNSITACVPLLAFLFTLYFFLSGSLRAQSEFTAHQTLRQSQDYLSYKASEVIALSNTLIYTPSLRRILEKPLEEYKKDVVLQFHDAMEMTTLFQSMIAGRPIGGIRLYVDSSLIYANENRMFFDYSRIQDKPYHEALLARAGNLVWLTADELGEVPRTIAACRLVKDYAQFDRFIGMLRIDLSEEVLASLVRQAQATPGAAALLFNAKGSMIVPSDLPGAEREALIAYALSHARSDEIAWEYATIERKSRLLGVAPIPGTDWILLSSIPMSDILAPSGALRAPLFFIALFCLGITATLAFFLSRGNTRRVERLLEEMALLESGRFVPADSQESWTDDIGILTHQFHRMQERLRHMLQQHDEAQERLRRSELRALQAQINPHFLYNTLDFIHWSAIEVGARELAQTVYALSRFYRLSLGEGAEMVPISQELDHVRAYMRVQNARFENRVTLRIEVPEEMMGVMLPRITLQPLVENALYHGILPKGDAENEIRIEGCAEAEGVRLRVLDDGVGIEAERLEPGEGKGDRDAQRGGYGLGNIRERLRLTYGKTARLRIDGRIGVGTAVEIWIPMNPEGEPSL